MGKRRNATAGDDFAYKLVGAEIPYEELKLEQQWEQFNVSEILLDTVPTGNNPQRCH